MNGRLGISILLIVAVALIGLYAGWQNILFLMLALLLVSGLYVFGLTRLWRNAGLGRGIPLWRAACFFAGMLILALALSTPVDELADRAFSMHMLQHMLLMKVIAPLLLLGEFTPVFLWAIGKPAARHTAASWTRSRRLAQFWKRLSQPWLAWTLFAMCLWIWHIPALYQAALESEPLHDLEHFLFLGTSLLFWWYLLRSGRDGPVRYGAIVMYLFTTLLHESALGGLLTFSTRNWYPFYAASNPWGLSPLSDQQLAGVIMWLPGGILFGVLMIVYFGAWLQAIERQVQSPREKLIHTGEVNE